MVIRCVVLFQDENGRVLLTADGSDSKTCEKLWRILLENAAPKVGRRPAGRSKPTKRNRSNGKDSSTRLP